MSKYGMAINSPLPIEACRRGIATHPMYHRCDKCDCKSFCEIFPLVQENKKLLEVSDAEFYQNLKKANAELEKLRKKNKPNALKKFFEKVADCFDKFFTKK